MLQKIKNKTTTAIDLTKERFDKTFDFAKIKSNILKDKIDLKIQKKAVLNLKAELLLRQKSFDDFSDEEIERLIDIERKKIISDLKTKSLVAVLAFLGLDFLI